jgi:predicted PurR-regulated permease PerM
LTVPKTVALPLGHASLELAYFTVFNSLAPTLRATLPRGEFLPYNEGMNIHTRTILKVLTVTALFVGFIYGLYLTSTILTWLIMAFTLALAFNPPVAWLERKIPGHSRILATLLMFFAISVVVLVLAVTLFPPVVTQTEQLIHNLPSYTQQLSKPGTFVSDFVNQYGLIAKIQNSQAELVSRLTNASGSFVGFVASLFSSLIALVSIIGLTFFMLLEGPAWLATLWEVVPNDRRKHVQGLANEMYRAMVGYVNGKILAAFLAGLSAAVMLIILRVPYAAALALVVALLSIIPMFGATLAAIVVVLVCLFTAVADAVIMAIFFSIYQQVENNIIQPIIFKKTVDVSPLLVFVSVLIGTSVAGILGALIAIPVTASLQILARDFLSSRGLDSQIPDKRALKKLPKA